jgi:OOP family OmpA-OmpF porin
MKLNMMTIAVAGACALPALPALADDAYRGAWYLLPNIGVMHPDSDLKADDYNFSYGLRVGKELNEKWDIQLGLTHVRADEDSRAYSSGHYRQTTLGLDMLYFLSRDKFRPFLLAGLGAARNSVHYNGAALNPDADGSYTSWMGNIGVGAQYLFSENIGLQADIRQVYSRAKADGGLFGSSSRETVGNTYLNMGLVIRFGAPRQVAAAKPVPAEVMPREPLPERISTPVVKAAPEPVRSQEPVFAKMTIQSEVLFGFDQSELKDAGKRILDAQVVEQMKAKPQIELLLITGHTDRIGSDKYNQDLSERRAQSVKDYLISQDVEAARLHSVGRGESYPLVECTDTSRKDLIQCLQPNRRVELEIEEQRATR